MTMMVHAVIAKDDNGKVLEVVACFSERQVPIAKSNICMLHPQATVEVKTLTDEFKETYTVRH